MSGSINKVDQIVTDYRSGAGIPQLADLYSLSRSAIRYQVKKAGVLRSRSDAVRLASEQGRLGSGLRGKTREFTPSHCAAISESKKKWGEQNAVGTSVKPSGYIEHTRGPNKGRSVHVTTMEARLGRKLLLDECVHHIDGNRANNEDNNLALVTRSGHTRLHRREQRLSTTDTKDQ